MKNNNLSSLKIGWLSASDDFRHPADQRTFWHYARIRGLNWEIARLDQRYDVVYLSQRADITQWVNYKKGKIIYELSDSYLTESQQIAFKPMFRGLAKFVTRQTRFLSLSYRNALERMLKRADAVFCGTDEQRKLIEPFNMNIHRLVAFHEDLIRVVKPSYQSVLPFRFVWEGLPALTGFKSIVPILETLKDQQDFTLHLITDIRRGRYLNKYFPIETRKLISRIIPFSGVYLYEWNPHLFSSIVTACDLAIIPIPLDRPFWVGKPANKLLLFWRMGMPVLTSATPAYKKEMDNCGLDMACTTLEDWEEKINKYMHDEKIRLEAAKRAKAYVDCEYSEEKLIALWDAAFTSVL